MLWLRQRALEAVMDGKRVLALKADGDYLDIKLADDQLPPATCPLCGFILDSQGRCGCRGNNLGYQNPSQKLLAQHSTCPCPTCGGSYTDEVGVRTIIGDFGEELLPCPYCVTLERPFISTRETIIIAGWGESASAISHRLLANLNQAIEEVWAPRPRKVKTLSDSQFIESRRRYIK